jgi:16S rRNA processing protein RimM
MSKAPDSPPENSDSTTPAAADTPAGVVRARPASRKPRTQAPRQRRGPRSLAETAGPAPAADLSDVKLTVGVIAGTHGVQGELKLKLLTDHPEHLPTIREVFLGESDEPTEVRGFRFQGDQGLILLAGTETPEEGKKLGGLKVRIRGTDAVPLKEGEYFLFQLIGLQAENLAGDVLGEVVDLIETGAHDVLVITTPDGTEMLVPNHPSYVLDILPGEGRILIQPLVYRD